MRKIVLLFALLMGATTLSAQSTAEEWIKQFEASLGKRFAYGIGIVENEAYEPLTGGVMVEGDSYYMWLGDNEVYSDGELRYEIDNARREVTEDRVDLTSHDLFANPTRAFAFAPEEFEMSLRFSQNDEVASVELTPRDMDFGITKITLTLEREGDSVNIRQIGYDYDGDTIVISLCEYEDDGWKMPKWSEANYETYDIVSFL